VPHDAIDRERPVERLVEQPVGEGHLLERERLIGRVHYHLSVYRHYSDIEAEPVPLHLEVEGRITPLDRLDVTPFRQQRTELTLRLADGRLLDFWLVDQEGALRSTGRGLYSP
jgi:hypothetical protein